jgi:hypothetical protein
MAIVIGAALAILSVLVTLYPFFKSRFNRRAGDAVGTVAGESANVQAIYDAIGTLHLEYQLGNIPDEQYREQLRNYRLQAARVLWEQDLIRDETEALETEILAARTSLSAETGGDLVPVEDADAADSDDGRPASHPLSSSQVAAPKRSDQ